MTGYTSRLEDAFRESRRTFDSWSFLCGDDAVSGVGHNPIDRAQYRILLASNRRGYAEPAALLAMFGSLARYAKHRGNLEVQVNALGDYLADVAAVLGSNHMTLLPAMFWSVENRTRRDLELPLFSAIDLIESAFRMRDTRPDRPTVSQEHDRLALFRGVAELTAVALGCLPAAYNPRIMLDATEAIERAADRGPRSHIDGRRP